MGWFGPNTWSEQARANDRAQRADVRRRRRSDRARKASRRREWRQHPIRTAWYSRR